MTCANLVNGSISSSSIAIATCTRKNQYPHAGGLVTYSATSMTKPVNPVSHSRDSSSQSEPFDSACAVVHFFHRPSMKTVTPYISIRPPTVPSAREGYQIGIGVPVSLTPSSSSP